MQRRAVQAMGNCMACKESAPTPDPVAFPITFVEAEETKDIPIVLSKVGQHRHSLTAVEHTSNGNARTGLQADTGGSLHRDKSLRVLYSRIQPLTRGSEAKLKEMTDNKLNLLFDLYKDADDLILAEGMERLLNDMTLSPEEFKVLVLAWRLNAERMCQFSRPEFTTGLRDMRADSLSTLNVRLNEVAQELLRDADLFKDLYRFTFRFGLDHDVGQRTLPTDMAICLWRIVFSLRPSPILDRWLEYLSKHPVSGIPRDTWDMFLYLTDQLGGDLSQYDDSHAWPSVFDDFVEHENDRVNQNVAKVKEDVFEECA